MKITLIYPVGLVKSVVSDAAETTKYFHPRDNRASRKWRSVGRSRKTHPQVPQVK
jgi:hypothetical protein